MSQKRTNNSSKLRKSFTIIILACVLIIFFVGFEDIRARVRDNKRKADISEIAKALELYYDRHGDYPTVDDDDWSGWDTTYEPEGHSKEFISALAKDSILLNDAIDPYNDANYFYRYKKFPPGSYGCNKSFYILQIVNFETAQEKHGVGSCPDHDFAGTLTNGYTVMRIE